MDFWKVDAEDLLVRMKTDRDLFSAAVGQMQLCDNYDNRLPSGLMEFHDFFYAHHQQVYKEDQDTVYQLFLSWLDNRGG